MGVTSSGRISRYRFIIHKVYKYKRIEYIFILYSQLEFIKLSKQNYNILASSYHINT